MHKANTRLSEMSDQLTVRRSSSEFWFPKIVGLVNVSYLIWKFNPFVFPERTAELLNLRFEPVSILALSGSPPTYLMLVIAAIVLGITSIAFFSPRIPLRFSAPLALISFLFLSSSAHSFFSAVSHDFFFPLYANIGLTIAVFGKNGFSPIGIRLTVALMGLGLLHGGLCKLYLGSGEFGEWITTDNLRNKLLIRFQVALQKPIPNYVTLLTEHPILWKSSAFVVVFAQIASIVGVCNQIRWARWISFFSILLGLIGLIIFFQIIWVTPWIPLAFLALIPAKLNLSSRREKVLAGVAASIIILQIFASLYFPRQSRLLYPFGTFKMYSNVQKTEGKSLRFKKSFWEIKTSPEITLWNKNQFRRRFSSITGMPKETLIAGAQVWLGKQGYKVLNIDVFLEEFELSPHPSRTILRIINTTPK